MNRYYVYAYLRSKDSETAKEKTPYYIGKGTAQRMYEKHTISVPKNKNYIVVIKNNMLEEDAFALEESLIKYYGRKDLGTGILLNMTNGGDRGPSGRSVSAGSRSKSSKSNRGQKRSEQTKRNIREALMKIDLSGENNHFYGKKHTRKARNVMSAAKKGKTYEEIYGKEQGTIMREKRRKQMSNRTIKESTIEKLSKPKGPQNRVSCPYCNKEGGISNMKRHHFDNCKKK